MLWIVGGLLVSQLVLVGLLLASARRMDQLCGRIAVLDTRAGSAYAILAQQVQTEFAGVYRDTDAMTRAMRELEEPEWRQH